MTRGADADRSEGFRFDGAVLAGGRSRRFGRDKCAHAWRGRALLEHALAALAAAERRFVVGGPPRHAPGATWLPDERDDLGALGGLQAALRHAHAPWLALAACDMPCLPGELWPLLADRAGTARVVVPEGPTGLEPLAGLYHRDALPDVDALAAAGGGALRDLATGPHGRVVPWAELRGHLAPGAFLNVNRPEDLP